MMIRPENLIKGNPYYYRGGSGLSNIKVMYNGLVKMADGTTRHNFLFRRGSNPGFVNLDDEQVIKLIKQQ